MIAAKLIACAKALSEKFPDQRHRIGELVSAVERIDREFDGEQRIELLTKANHALQRHIERSAATAETRRALAQLRESHASMLGAMKRLTEAKGKRGEEARRELGADWPRSSLPKKVVWH